MPSTFTLENTPAGIALTNGLGGENISVVANESVATWHGEEFARRAEFITHTFPSLFVPHTSLHASQVDTFLAIVRADKTAMVYCNEMQIVASMRLKQPFRDIKKGDLVEDSVVSEVAELELRDRDGNKIEIPPDSGYLFLMSHGWRKVLSYDWRQLPPHNQPQREENLQRMFAGFYNRMLFRSLDAANEQAWNNLFEWGWFPFVWMDDRNRITLINFASEGRKPQTFLDEQCTRFSANLRDRIERWKKIEEFQLHIPFIESAASSFEREDYVGALSTLMARIEGVLRLLVATEMTQPGKITPEKMASLLVENRTEFSSLLPSAFKFYLIKHYFRDFTTGGDTPLSRHSAGHGVSSATDYNRETASVAFMVLDQIGYYLVD